MIEKDELENSNEKEKEKENEKIISENISKSLTNTKRYRNKNDKIVFYLFNKYLSYRNQNIS